MMKAVGPVRSSLAILLLVLGGAARAVPGDFDTSFGEGGIAGQPVPGTIKALDIDAAGRLVAVGSARTKFPSTVPSFIARSLPDGRIDLTFADSGLRTTYFDSAHTLGTAAIGVFIHILPDGRMIRGDRRDPFQDPPYFVVERVLANGSVDPAYGVMATVSAPLDEAQAVVLEDGALVVGGIGTMDNVVTGYDREGRADPRWIPNARSFDCGSTQARLAIAIARAPGNKILVAQSLGPAPTPPSPALCMSRLNADGTLDTTYGTGGHAPVVEPRLVQLSRAGTVRRVLVQSDGSAVVVHERAVPIYPETPHLVFIAPDGRLDTARGDGGILPLATITGVLADIALQPDGKILVAGNPVTGAVPPIPDYSRPQLIRLTRAGARDTTFGRDGTGAVRLANASRLLLPSAIRVGASGAIFVAGGAEPVGSIQVLFFDESIAKIQGDPPPAPPPSNDTGGGGGGCGTINGRGPFDPVLPTLAMIAAALLWRRLGSRLRGNDVRCTR